MNSHVDQAGSRKPKVLILFGVSGRQVSAAGPIQSLAALIKGNKDSFDFSFVANASMKPASWNDVPNSQWSNREGSRYYWTEAEDNRLSLLLWIILKEKWDLIVLNSFFDREYSFPLLLFRKFGIAARTPVLISPRGEFAAGALSLRSGRKKFYFSLIRGLGLLKGVWLHATADHERKDIEAQNLPSLGVLEAPVARILPDPPPDLDTPRELCSPLRIAFLGRIAAVKNLHFALETLSKVGTACRFEIYGPIDDVDYWQRCEKKIAALPNHIEVKACGTLNHDKVAPILAECDLFFLPTLGENFGHAINEALAVGLPVLISDRTPWRGLKAAGAGWDFSLQSVDPFAKAIDAFAQATKQERKKMRVSARRLAEKAYLESDANQLNRNLLLNAMQKKSSQ